VEADSAASRSAHGHWPHRGTNQTGMRAYNERLVLSLLRSRGSLAKMDIARITGLSAQTVSVIMRQLEADGLLLRGEPQRGKVGQPSIPMSLAPEGVFFFGLKIGRRSADLALIDFLGRIRHMLSLPYPYPMPAETLAFATRAIDETTARMNREQAARIAGLGVAMPFQLWNWPGSLGAPEGALEAWRETDVVAALGQCLPFPVYLHNDATAACGAELVFGGAQTGRDFVYFYVGSFIGGGVVLGDALYSGRTGNAGAIGSMLVPDGEGGVRQLIEVASLDALARRLEAAGAEPEFLWQSPDRWPGGHEPIVEAWIARAARAIAAAAVSAAAVIDFETAVIDGWIPAPVRTRLVEATQRAIGALDTAGLEPPRAMAGSVGPHARALGAASLPLSERFSIGRGFG